MRVSAIVKAEIWYITETDCEYGGERCRFFTINKGDFDSDFEGQKRGYCELYYEYLNKDDPYMADYIPKRCKKCLEAEVKE